MIIGMEQEEREDVDAADATWSEPGLNGPTFVVWGSDEVEVFSEALVERVAQAIYSETRLCIGSNGSWENLRESSRREYLDIARAAIYGEKQA
jgi:pimeloyl-ACP methyl ester carboxylesterase